MVMPVRIFIYSERNGKEDNKLYFLVLYADIYLKYIFMSERER